MARQIHELNYTTEELDALLARTAGKMFVIVEDKTDNCKRIFRTQEDADIWFNARDDKQMTPEIAALEFSGSTIPGTEQYKLNFNILNVDDSSTYGSIANLRFSFSTIDTLNNNIPIEEPVEMFFKFTNDNTVRTVTKRFNYVAGTTTFDITEYLGPDVNDIVITATGLTTGLSVTANATYTSVYIPFSSVFDITEIKNVGDNFSIPYKVSSIGDITIECLIDSEKQFNAIGENGAATSFIQYKVSEMGVLEEGLHTLQMRAYTTVGNKRFSSEMLYFEFIVGSPSISTTLIKAVFSSDTDYFLNRYPGLVGEQYVDYTLTWAYYSKEYPTAIVLWKTFLNGVETIVGSRKVDEMAGSVGVMPDPVKFQPDTVGTYDLCAYISGKEDEVGSIGSYTINVVKNSAGLSEADGYTIKLDSKGRSNEEPDTTIADWSSNGYKTTFNNRMSFDGLAGYTGLALRFDNGAVGINDCKPFAVENNILNNGCAVSFHFCTRNVEDEDIPLIEIGDYNKANSAYFAIYGKKVLMRPSLGKSMEYSFASEEDTHLAIIINPKIGVTDAQMMFFIFNGIEAPGQPYDATALFNIGSYTDTSDYGKIKFGTESTKAAIDIYNVRVYPFTLSMWQGMSNFMIDKGGDIGKMMRKNNLFTNNDFTRPIISRIKEQYRVLEIIGNLGLLETSAKKESFFGSCRYTDPFNPKFNFERLDGGAFIETAGQSRLEDKMAKSFHLDLNENDTVATYQNGKITYKNRIIFADNNIPENGVRIDVCGADSSIARNAAHMKMVNKYYPNIEYEGNKDKYPYTKVLQTPPQRYALSGQWEADMKATYPSDKGEFKWEYNINFAPDSVPIVIVWHLTEDDPIEVYGLGQMTEEKKASYANGNHSIYLKERLSDGTLDPLDRYPGTKGTRGWDNDGVIEVEFVNPSNLTLSESTEGFFDETTRDYSFELCFPKNKDFNTPEEKEKVWRIFYDEWVALLASTYQNQAEFDRIIEDTIHIPSFAMYYNKVLDKKCNDSLCRNLHVIRYNMGTSDNPNWKWWAKWWDVDVCCGLFQNNAMGVDPETDRTTLDANGKYVMAGTGMWLWDALEKNAEFQTVCKGMAAASYKAGWTAQTEKASQDEVTESFSESLYNLDGLLKFLGAYRKGNDYMVRMQGSSTPYRHGFIEDSYAYRESKMVIGSYAAKAASISASGATYPSAIKIIAATKWRFGIGTTSVNIKTGVEKSIEDGEFELQIPFGTTLGRDFLSIYGSDKIKSLDLSDFTRYLDRAINVTNLTQVQNLYIGYKNNTDLRDFNYDTSISFTGLNNLNRLIEFSLIGLKGITNLNLDNLNHLNSLKLAGTSIVNFNPADGTKFNTLELPDTIQTIQANNNKLGNISFWKSDTTNKRLVKMGMCPKDLTVLTLIGMGNDQGAHDLVHLWCLMLKDNPDVLPNAQITYRNINWIGMSKQDLLTLCELQPSNRNISGYIQVNDTLTSGDIFTLKEVLGENIFDKDNDLRIDARGGFILGAPSEIDAGNETNVTGIAFPINSEQGDIIYEMGTLSGNIFMPFEERTDASGIKYYQYKGTKLIQSTGKLTTTENNDDSYSIAVRGKTSLTSATAVILVKKRTYPEEATIRVHIPTEYAGCIKYDSVYNRYNISRASVMELDIVHTPQNTNGTRVSYNWKTNIPSIYGKLVTNILGNKVFNTLNVTSDKVLGYIKYTEFYANGLQLEHVLNIAIKQPTIVVNQLSNEVLLRALHDYNPDIAVNGAYDTDVELIPTLDFLKYDSYSDLQHIFEINEFASLRTLDLTGITNFGINVDAEGNTRPITMENNKSYYIDYFPSRDTYVTIPLHTILLGGTSVKGINLSPNMEISKLIYPSTTEKIVLDTIVFNEGYDFQIEGYGKIKEVTITNCTGLSSDDIKSIIANIENKSECILNIDNIDWSLSYQEILNLFSLYNKDNIHLKGKITLTSNVTRDNIIILSNLFGNNVFTYDNDFVITSNQTLVCAFSDKDTILSGEFVQFTAVKLPVTEQTDEWEFVSPVDGIFIDENGLVTTYETNVSHTVQVKVKVNGVALTTPLSLTVGARTYPTSNTIVGEGVIKTSNDYEYEIKLNPETFTGTVYCDWYVTKQE